MRFRAAKVADLLCSCVGDGGQASDEYHQMAARLAAGSIPTPGDWRSAWPRPGLAGDDFAEYIEVRDSGLLEEISVAVAEGYA